MSELPSTEESIEIPTQSWADILLDVPDELTETQKEHIDSLKKAGRIGISDSDS